MNPYVISPSVVQVSLDPELNAEFARLNARSNWRTLTTNLESCEEAPYLYFRVALKLKAGSSTYAGFATGAPFMLTRDKDVKKRAFFLRHWVRKVPESDNTATPVTSLSHMSIAAVDNELLLVRVDIDRPLSSGDTFKSVPFATWMFQVVQVDAVIKERPWIRFAFAVERTVTSDERDLVSASGLSLPLKGPNVKSSSQVLPRPSSVPARDGQHSHGTSQSTRPLSGPTLGHNPKQSSAVHRPSSTYTPVNPRPPAASYHPNPYAYASNRSVAAQMRQNVAPRAQYNQQTQAHPQQQQPVKGASRNYNRANTNPSNSTQAAVEQLRPVMHPCLRLWEDRNLDDPYQPIFITEDDNFEKKARRSWLVEEPSEDAKQFEYQKLFGIPSADYPAYYFKCPPLSGTDGEPDIEVVVRRKQRIRPDISELTGMSGDDESEANVEGPDNYSATVVAAANYNSILRDERSQLRNWLVEDVGREEEESEEDEEEDEGDGDYSD